MPYLICISFVFSHLGFLPYLGDLGAAVHVHTPQPDIYLCSRLNLDTHVTILQYMCYSSGSQLALHAQRSARPLSSSLYGVLAS